MRKRLRFIQDKKKHVSVVRPTYLYSSGITTLCGAFSCRSIEIIAYYKVHDDEEKV